MYQGDVSKRDAFLKYSIFFFKILGVMKAILHAIRSINKWRIIN